MMRVALVMLYMVLSVASASAECGWVLWTGDMDPDKRASRLIYMRREVFSTRDQCISVIDSIEKAADAKNDGPVERESFAFMSAPGPNRGTRRIYMCLTDVMPPEDFIRVK